MFKLLFVTTVLADSGGTIRFLSKVKRTLPASLLVAVMLFIAVPASAKGVKTRYGTIPSSYNSNAVEWLTGDCISARITDIQSDRAAEMLPGICLQDVLNGYWHKNSRSELDKQRKAELNIINRNYQ